MIRKMPLRCRFFGHAWKIWMTHKKVNIRVGEHVYLAHDFLADYCTRCDVKREMYVMQINHPAGRCFVPTTALMTSFEESGLWVE